MGYIFFSNSLMFLVNVFQLEQFWPFKRLIMVPFLDKSLAPIQKWQIVVSIRQTDCDNNLLFDTVFTKSWQL